jgi:hypothetical protein
MTEKIETFLPGFGGFHGTQWENLFPFFRELCADRFAQEEGDDGLDSADFGEILRETSDASLFFTSLAGRFCRRFDAETSRWLGFELGLMFAELDDRTVPGSTTDHILATMPVRNASRLFGVSAQEQHRRLVESIRERFAPYGGLIPYPADAVEEWLAQPIERWGRTELCDLLAVFVDPDIDDRLYADMTGGVDVRTAFENSVDWKRFSELAAARRRTRSKSSGVAEMPTNPNP